MKFFESFLLIFMIFVNKKPENVLLKKAFVFSACLYLKDIK